MSLSYWTPDGQAVTQAMQPEAAVEVGDHGVRERGRVLVLAHEDDAPARRVHLLVPELVRRARGQAEPAVDAVVDQVGCGASDAAPRRGRGCRRRRGRSCCLSRRRSTSGSPASVCHGSTALRTSSGASGTTHGAGARASRSVGTASAPPGSVIHHRPERRAADERGAQRVGGAQRRRGGPRAAPTTLTTVAPVERWRVALALPQGGVVLDHVGLAARARAAPRRWSPRRAARWRRRSARARRRGRPAHATSRHVGLERRVGQRGGRRREPRRRRRDPARRQRRGGRGCRRTATWAIRPSVPNEPVNSLARS